MAGEERDGMGQEGQMAVAGGVGGRRARWQGMVGQEGNGREPDGAGAVGLGRSDGRRLRGWWGT